MNQKKLFWMFAGLLTLLPGAVLHGRYAPVLDDYIMYQGYHLYDTSYLLKTVRVWTTRPVANLLDVFLWSRFYDHLFLLFLLFTVMRVAAVALLCRFFDSQGYQGARMPLCLLLLWCPVGVEATGWLAAASRLVPGLLFLGLALFFLTEQKWGRFGVCLLFSFLCHEQIALVGCLLCTVTLFREHRRLTFLPPMLGLCTALFYLFAAPFSTTSRGGLGFGWSGISQIVTGWVLGVGKLIPKSTEQGGRLLLQNPWLGAALLLGTACLLFCLTPCKSRRSARKLGIGLFAICYLPFLVLETPSLSFRMLYPSLIGLALILGSMGHSRIITGVLIICFCLGSAGELKDYQLTGQKDRKLLTALAEQMTSERVTVVNCKAYYVTPSVLYGQHILSVTHSDWALTAGLRAVSGNVQLYATSDFSEKQAQKP